MSLIKIVVYDSGRNGSEGGISPVGVPLNLNC